MSEQIEIMYKMINSSDKENVYLAACLLRSPNNELSKSETKKALNQIPLEYRIKDYIDVCEELGEDQLSLDHFSHLPKHMREKSLAYAQLQQIVKLLNDKWKPDWNNTNEYKWYPWFRYNSGLGLAFDGSGCHVGVSVGGVAFFKDEVVSNFVGKTFIYIYEKLIN